MVQIHLPSHPDVTAAQARDPRFAADWGARYLAAQHKRFGSWRLALAAYNAGPGNVESGKWSAIPETTRYVKNVLAAAGGMSGGAAADPLSPSPAAGAAPPEPPALGLPDLSGAVFQNIGEHDPLRQLQNLTSAVAGQPQPVMPAAPAAPVPQAPANTTPVKTTGLRPAFNQKLNALISASGGRLHVVSGYRSVAEQRRLWNVALKKYGSASAARKWVAPPGRSNHNKGIAADLGGDLGWAHANAARFGLYFPLSNEAWHIEPKGSR